jgi:hypothetical protein
MSGMVVAAPVIGCADHANQNPSSSSGGLGGVGAGGQMTPGMGCGLGSAGAASGISGGGTNGGGSSGGSSIPATFETVKLVIQGGGPIMTCSAAPCHGLNGMAPPGRPLALPSNDDQLLYTNLTSYVSTACGNVKLVTPCDPAGSALPKILSGPCGTTPRMPYMCTAQDGNCIPDEYIAAISQWIANGAPRQ